MCAVEKVCGCVLHRGQRGEGWCVSSTLSYSKVNSMMTR